MDLRFTVLLLFFNSFIFTSDETNVKSSQEFKLRLKVRDNFNVKSMDHRFVLHATNIITRKWLSNLRLLQAISHKKNLERFNKSKMVNPIRQMKMASDHKTKQLRSSYFFKRIVE